MCSATASVYKLAADQRSWSPQAMGAQLDLYTQPATRQSRIVAVGPDEKAVVNAMCFPRMEYTASNDKFHQFNDAYNQLFGLSFAKPVSVHPLCRGLAPSNVGVGR